MNANDSERRLLKGCNPSLYSDLLMDIQLRLDYLIKRLDSKDGADEKKFDECFQSMLDSGSKLVQASRMPLSSITQ